MAKKPFLFGLAAAALAAFALPAAASASPELRDENGKAAVGAEITLTSNNAVRTNTALGTLECQHYTFRARIEQNSGSHVSAGGTQGTTSNCFAGSAQLTITQPTLISMTTAGEDRGTLSTTFIADIGPFECHFAGTGEFTYSTGTGNNSIHLPGITLIGDEICEPEEGHPIFEGDFTLTTAETGQQVWFQ